METENISLVNHKIHEQFQNLMRRREDQLLRTVKQRLTAMRYIFENEQAFLKFCDERIARVAFNDRPFDHELRVDYKSLEEPGKLILRFNSKTEINYGLDGKVTMTFEQYNID
ncbi:MAG TPA: hypothetical protein VEA58_05410 [Anaerovoracaceae bacterium]|nr:hypothetical protein [Anaerovoracaceae bacterium]